jgi:hypothetical protein
MSAREFPVNTVPPVFIYQDQQRMIRAVHHPHYRSTIIGQPSEWDNVCIAFASDVHGGHITTLVLPAEEIFTTTPEISVPTTETMVAMLADAEGGNILPLDRGPNVVQVRSRRMIPVPHAYIRQFLFRALTPSQAWNQVGEQVLIDGRADDCEVLLNFLKAAAVSSFGGVRNEPHGPPAVAIRVPVQPTIGNEEFYTHLADKLRTVLPGSTMAPTPSEVLQQVVDSQNRLHQTLSNTAIANRRDRLLEREEALIPKSFSEVFPAFAAKIRKLCGAGNDDGALPEFWKAHAKEGGKKKYGFMLLQEGATTRARHPNSAGVHPIISANLYEQISKFSLGTSDLEDLRVGLSPFLMCPVGYERADQQRRLNEQYLMLSDGVAPSLADSNLILPAVYNIPSNVYQLVDFIGAYSVVLDVLLGVEHRLSKRFYKHHRFWVQQTSTVVNAMPPNAHGHIILGTLRFLQVNLMRYINEEMYTDAGDQGEDGYDGVVPLPDFASLESVILNRTFQVLPLMPASYQAQVAAQVQASQSVSNSSGNSNTPKAPRQAAAANDTSRSVQVSAPTNHVVTAWHERFDRGSKSILTLRTDGAGSLPKSSDGQHHLCLSYHFKGTCYNNCRSRSTHRQLNAAETTDFQAFVDKYL